MMNRNFYQEIKDAEFKPITFRLYNKIDDDMIPSYLAKKNKEVYGIDDFEYITLVLDSKEKFLLSMHNKKFLNAINILKQKVEENDCVVDVDFNMCEVNVIKLNSVKFD